VFTTVQICRAIEVPRVKLARWEDDELFQPDVKGRVGPGCGDMIGFATAYRLATLAAFSEADCGREFLHRVLRLWTPWPDEARSRQLIMGEPVQQPLEPPPDSHPLWSEIYAGIHRRLLALKVTALANEQAAAQPAYTFPGRAQPAKDRAATASNGAANGSVPRTRAKA
jgi:hypothetical protein